VSEAQALVQRFIEETFNRGNMVLADEVYAPSFVSHEPTGPKKRDPGYVKQFVGMYRAAFPDIHTAVEDLISEGDKVAYRWAARGTHEGELMGIASTGNPVTMTGITIGRISGGKIVEEWNLFDQLGMMQQLGVASSSEQTGA